MNKVKHEIMRAVWDTSKAGLELLRIRGISVTDCSMHEFYKTHKGDFRVQFVKKSALLKMYKRCKDGNQLKHTDVDFEEWLLGKMKGFSLFDTMRMRLIFKLTITGKKNGLREFSYFNDLNPSDQIKVKDKFYSEKALDKSLGVNRLKDLVRGDFASENIKQHQQIMSGAPTESEKLADEVSDRNAMIRCQSQMSCSDPAYCRKCGYCEATSRVEDTSVIDEYLDGYMPNFFEDGFALEELKNYDPSWSDLYTNSEVRHRRSNPASQMYNFNVNWANSDEHLQDEFRKWLYMRRPQRFENRGRKVRDEKSTNILQNFRFWHVDNVGIRASKKMELYKVLYEKNDKTRASQSVNRLRNSANKGLEFFELSILGARYITDEGYISDFRLRFFEE